MVVGARVQWRVGRPVPQLIAVHLAAGRKARVKVVGHHLRIQHRDRVWQVVIGAKNQRSQRQGLVDARGHDLAEGMHACIRSSGGAYRDGLTT